MSLVLKQRNQIKLKKLILFYLNINIIFILRTPRNFRISLLSTEMSPFSQTPDPKVGSLITGLLGLG